MKKQNNSGGKQGIGQMLLMMFKQNPLLIVAIVYSISPIDLIPDAIPFLGSLDDTIVLVMPMLKMFQQILNQSGVDNGLSRAVNTAVNAGDKVHNLTTQTKQQIGYMNSGATMGDAIKHAEKLGGADMRAKPSATERSEGAPCERSEQASIVAPQNKPSRPSDRLGSINIKKDDGKGAGGGLNMAEVHGDIGDLTIRKDDDDTAVKSKFDDMLV